MRAPLFWYAPPGLLATLLAPAAALWRWSVRKRLARPGQDVAVPVICVGNVVAGGAGKTPLVADLSARLVARGLNVATLSRGHGGRLKGPKRVDPRFDRATDVGDEPLLLAGQVGAAWIARDRGAGAVEAVKAGAEVLVLDDGFQNPSPVKSLSLLVIDGTDGLGNGRVMPAGPLRESLADALSRADVVVVMGEDKAGVAALVGNRRPILRAMVVPDPVAAESLRDRPVLAFAGIARPEKFFTILAASGARIVDRVAYSDHYPFGVDEVRALILRAESLGAVPVTTAKDAVRLPQALRAQVAVLPVTVVWEGGDAAIEALLTRVCAPNGKA